MVNFENTGKGGDNDERGSASASVLQTDVDVETVMSDRKVALGAEAVLATRARVVLTRCVTPNQQTRQKARRASVERMTVDDALSLGAKVIDLSESDSDTSIVTATSRASRSSSAGLWRKRPREGEADSGEDDVSSPRRGRGRPPTTGQYVGLAQAKAELNRAREEELRLIAERELAEELRLSRVASTAAQFRKVSESEPAMATLELGDCDATQLESMLMDSVNTVLKVANRSKNLKGTCVKALKDAAVTIKASFQETRARSMPEEMALLVKANRQLALELKELRRELEQLRASQVPPASSQVRAQTLDKTPSTEEVVPAPVSALAPELEMILREVMVHVGTMINARFEGLESRLLPEERRRPPLAADRRNAERAANGARVETAPSTATPSRTTPKGKKAPEGHVAPVAVPAPPPPPLQEAWNTVTTRRRKAREAPPATSGATKVAHRSAREAPPARPTDKKMAPKPMAKPKTRMASLRPPRTAAVVITMMPGAKEKGLNYAKILAEAKSKINLGALGVPPLRMRTAATGARILEIPGAEKEEKANSLAAKLREVFEGASEDVRVSRPSMTCDLRVSGLDDSVMPLELVDSLAKAGGCSSSEIKSGEIRKGAAGMGAAFVRCPKSTAKKIMAGGGRLLVGWVAAQVRILDVRPRRCYRCLEMGHVRAQCKSEVDRSDECHRCGQKGHKANDCSAAPHCTLCATAGKAADHLSGGKACAKPPTKNGASRRKVGTEAKAKSQSTRPTRVAQENMEEG